MMLSVVIWWVEDQGTAQQCRWYAHEKLSRRVLVIMCAFDDCVKLCGGSEA